MTFAELGLGAHLVKTLAARGYETPTDVQRRSIPAAMEGVDLLVSSQTGSGKTAAFLLPSLERLAAAPRAPGIGPRILVLAPTRELALQVTKAAMDYGAQLRRFRVAALVGGAPYGPQLKALSRAVDVVVATPGRLMDHLNRGSVDFGRVETLVLDEADRMLDMGFIEDIETIVARLPKERQTLLFSATLDGVVGKLAARVTRSARRIEVAPPPAAESKIAQLLLFADNFGHKSRLLDSLLRDTELTQALVFTATKKSAEDLSAELREQGFSAGALHGDMNQGHRNRTLRELREGRMRVLVATDVAARGIDVPGISHVINFDLPRQAEDYVHRIGRTGRAGREGTAITLAGHGERHMVRAIERFTDQQITVGVIAGLEPSERPTRAAPRAGQGGWGARNDGPGTGRPKNGGREWKKPGAGGSGSRRGGASGWH